MAAPGSVRRQAAAAARGEQCSEHDARGASRVRSDPPRCVAPATGDSTDIKLAYCIVVTPGAWAYWPMQYPAPPRTPASSCVGAAERVGHRVDLIAVGRVDGIAQTDSLEHLLDLALGKRFVPASSSPSDLAPMPSPGRAGFQPSRAF